MERAKSILDEAQQLIEGARQSDYGTPAESFNNIAEYWNAYLSRHSEWGRVRITGRDVAMMMTLLKIARESNRHKHDNLVDIIGYAACAATLIEK